MPGWRPRQQCRPARCRVVGTHMCAPQSGRGGCATHNGFQKPHRLRAPASSAASETEDGGQRREQHAHQVCHSAGHGALSSGTRPLSAPAPHVQACASRKARVCCASVRQRCDALPGLVWWAPARWLCRRLSSPHANCRPAQEGLPLQTTPTPSAPTIGRCIWHTSLACTTRTVNTWLHHACFAAPWQPNTDTFATHTIHNYSTRHDAQRAGGAPQGQGTAASAPITHHHAHARSPLTGARVWPGGSPCAVHRHAHKSMPRTARPQLAL
jgi:hypothetical protein